MNIFKKFFQKHTKIKIILLVLIIGSIAWRLFSPKQVKTTYQTSITDLKTGEKVAVFGTENTDGSIVAQNIQLNPIMREENRRDAKPTPTASL